MPDGLGIFDSGDEERGLEAHVSSAVSPGLPQEVAEINLAKELAEGIHRSVLAGVRLALPRGTTVGVLCRALDIVRSEHRLLRLTVTMQNGTIIIEGQK